MVHRLDTGSQTLFDGNLLYTFNDEARRGKLLDPAIPKRNKAIGFEESKNLWNNANIPGLPDVTLSENSPARNCAVDISKMFAVNGTEFSALPGFEKGYFKGASPDAGMLQYGENMQKFIRMHSEAEQLLKMLRK